jgi:phosphoglycolate phosphatase
MGDTPGGRFQQGGPSVLGPVPGLLSQPPRRASARTTRGAGAGIFENRHEAGWEQACAAIASPRRELRQSFRLPGRDDGREVVENGGGQLIVLFDLDLTLLDIPGDRDIRSCALDKATAIAGLLDRVDDRGRTDRWLVDEIGRLGLAATSGLWERYAAAYNAELRAALALLPPSSLPGAAEILVALRRTSATLGVSTGNLRANAIAKLTHAQLSSFFAPLLGGFGDDHADRANIVRAGAKACGHRDGCRLVVVGDTVYDVKAALDVGAVSIAVATGHATDSELSSAGAAVVLPNLEDTAAALSAIVG